MLFFVSAAIVSSSAELALSDSTGIGLSGVVYAYFGFMWPTRGKYPAFRAILTRKTINLLIVWLGFCVVMTWLEVWAIGNAAHIAGILFGILVAAAVSLRWQAIITQPAMAAFCVACVVPAWWCPWSPLWNAVQGDLAYEAEQYDLAIARYEKSLRRGLEEPDWVLYNLAQLYYFQDEMLKFSETYDRLAEASPDFAAELRNELGVDTREMDLLRLGARSDRLEDGGESADPTASMPATQW
jgi:GlpG protein